MRGLIILLDYFITKIILLCRLAKEKIEKNSVIEILFQVILRIKYCRNLGGYI